MRYLIILIFFILLFCKASQNIQENKNIENNNNNSIYLNQEEVFDEDQPRSVVETDDPYFLEKEILPGEVFRVLITRNNYQIRQLSFLENIEKIKDISGDKEQLKLYNRFYDQINFKDWEFEGVLSVKLNPQTSNIEKIKYYENYIPKIKQALELFIQDISRYKFKYLKENTYPDEFLIRVLWRIRKDPDLTEELAKERAIEYLKKYLKK